jgi:hypothetical protein
MTSPDGITWTTQTAAAALGWSAVTFGGAAGQERQPAFANGLAVGAARHDAGSDAGIMQAHGQRAADGTGAIDANLHRLLPA